MDGIAVIGAGKMGGFIARQLPPAEVVIIDRDPRAADRLASALGFKGGDELAAAGSAGLIVIAVPGPAVDRVAAELAPHAAAGAVIVNVATNQTVAPAIKAAFPQLRFVEAKIIGNAVFMEMGGRSIMVVDAQDQATLDKLRPIFPGFGEVVFGEVDMVPAVNELATAEALRTGVRLRRRLERLGAPEAWRDTVIESVCAGTLAAYARRELGPFALALVEAITTEESSEKEG